MTHTRKMAYMAILSALSFLLMYLKFPLIPAANFLEIDFSILPILIGLLTLNLKSSYIILLLRTALVVLFNNSGPQTLIGLPMNVLALAIFVSAMALIWEKKRSGKTYLLASVVGTLSLTVSMLFLNYVYAIPAYAAFAQFDINQWMGISPYLFSVVAPFNLLQGVIFSVVFCALYTPLKPYLKKV